jgi:polyphosphate kinase
MEKNDLQSKNGQLERKKYEEELRRLQAELCKLQDWVKHKGLRAILIFEGRDAAGEGGTIRAFTERVSPRFFRQIALPAPSDREKSQMYIQRDRQHFPAAGEIVIFDRSWYNRAGVEYVMGFCSKEQHRNFLDIRPKFEKYIVDAGIILLKYWLEVGPKEQQRRFEACLSDPLRQWKLGPMHLESFRPWHEYSRARDLMFEATDSAHAPWHVIRSDDKRRAWLNCISHLLKMVPHKKAPREKIELPKRSGKHAYDDSKFLKGRKVVEEVFCGAGR